MKEFRLKIFLFLNRLSILQLSGSFLVVILLFGVLYTSFTPGINGVNTLQKEEFNIWKGLYFSIVTISSLGYGDMQPSGVSRLFSVIEVILGLAIMGILIAKLTSSRLSYHVKRLYVSDSHRQLYRYQSKIRTAQSEINNLTSTTLHKLIETPDGKEIPSEKEIKTIQDRIRRNFLKNFSEVSKVLNDLITYIDAETKSGDYFSEISSNIIKDLGDTIFEIIKQAHQFLSSIPEDKRARLLYGDPGKQYSELLKYIKRLCAIIIKYSKDNEVKLTFSTIESGCSKSQNEIVIISVAIYDINPPDQKNESPTDLKDN